MVMIDPDARRQRARRWVTRTLAAGLAVVGIVGLTTAPASAAMTCTGRPDSNTCLWIDGIGNGLFRVHVGIDVHMSLAAAQEYIDDAGDPFSVVVFGDDGGGADQALFIVPLIALGASTESGLSGDFETVVPGSALNEDPGQADEIRARVLLIDTDLNRVTGTYLSNQLSGNWG